MSSEDGGGELPVLKAGWLTKKGHVRRNWKERWFVLQGTKLKYYEKPPQPGKERAELGEIPLHKGSVAIDSSTQKDFMFTIQAAMVDGEKKNYLVKARTETDMKEWIEAIGLAGKEGVGSGVPPPNVAPRARPGTNADAAAPLGASAGGPGSGGAAASFADGASLGDDSLSSSLSSSSPSASSSSYQHPMDSDDSATILEPEYFASLSKASTSAGAGADLYRLKFSYDGQLSHLNMLFETKLHNTHFVWSGVAGMVGAHDFVLQLRCPALYALVSPQKKKKKPITVVDLKSVQPPLTPTTLGHLLIYLYSDDTSTINFSPAELVRLLQAAHTYDLPRLQAMCKQQLASERFLNLDTTYVLLKEAHDLSVGWAKELALDYVHRHIKDFVKNKEESKKLGIDLFHEVVALTTEEYVPRRVDVVEAVPEGTLRADFKQLHDRTLSGDSGDTTVKLQMQFIRFHRAVLSAHAKGFAEIFLNDRQTLPDDVTALLGIKHISPESFRALLKFVYYGDENVATTHACDIQSFADRMFMHDFKNVCDAAINSSLSHTNVMTVLAMTYSDQNKDSKQMLILRQKAVDFLVDNIVDVDLGQISSLPMSIDVLKCWQRRERAVRESSAPVQTSDEFRRLSSANSMTAASYTPVRQPPPPPPALPAEDTDEPPSRKAPPPPPLIDPNDLASVNLSPPVGRRPPPTAPLPSGSDYKSPLPPPPADYHSPLPTPPVRGIPPPLAGK